MMNAVDDARLRELLDVEKRLQDFVRAAQEDAARQIAAARATGEERLRAAREAAARADAEQARLERIEHDKAIAAIEAAHQASLLAITTLSADRVDELARWAVQQAIGDSGDGL